MGDLFGGNFNSADFYGSGLGDDPNVDPVTGLTLQAPYVPTGFTDPVTGLQITSPYVPPSTGIESRPATPSAPSVVGASVTNFLKWGNVPAPAADDSFDINAWGAALTKDFNTAVAHDTARNAAAPTPVNRGGTSNVTGGARGPSGPSGQQSSNFSQDVNSVMASITSLFAPIIAAKQQRAVARGAQARRPSPANSRGNAAGGSGDLTKYALIGGGALLLFGLVFVATKD